MQKISRRVFLAAAFTSGGLLSALAKLMPRREKTAPSASESLPTSRMRYYDSGGMPLAGALVYTFVPGTNRRKATWADLEKYIPNPNPVILDAKGEADMYWAGAYSISITTPLDDEVIGWTVENISANPFSSVETGAVASRIAGMNGATYVNSKPAWTGASLQHVGSKLRNTKTGDDYGALGNKSKNNLTALRNAILGTTTKRTDGAGRMYAGEVTLAPGDYLIDSAVDFGGPNGLTGLTIKGSGQGSTHIYFTGSAVLSLSKSKYITFKDISFTCDAIDSNLTAFDIAYWEHSGAAPLRSWHFERCAFNNFYRCFNVRGDALCSEFSFIDCKFEQCYELVNNTNPQAMNWNFFNCDWENESIETTKDKNRSCIFRLTQGMFVRWEGGSFVLHGSLVYANFISPGSFYRTSHKMSFVGVRIELADLEGKHAPLLDRVSDRYVNASNEMQFILKDSTILHRGRIPPTTIYFKVWNNVGLYICDVEAKGGRVVGILDKATAERNADVFIRAYGIQYEEDTSGRANTHDQHSVHLEPSAASNAASVRLDYRNHGSTQVCTVMSKRMYWRGPSGDLPRAGAKLNLPALPPHTTLLKLFVYRFSEATHPLTVELKDEADAKVYGAVSLLGSDMSKEVYVGKEVGFQIPHETALVLKFTGKPEVVKGMVGIDYQ